MLSTATDARIVVGVDGSDESELALRWTADIAALTQDEIEVVSAWHLPTTSGRGMFPDGWDLAADAEMAARKTISAVFGDDEPAKLSVVVRQGYPSQVLIDASESARMLVVGSRGLGGFAGLRIGSVGAVCAEHAHCPVVVVHPDKTVN